MQANHVVEQHETMPAGAIGQRDEAGQQGDWNVKHRERACRQRPGYQASQGGDEAGRAVAEIWKWLSGIDGQRRQHGQQRPVEVVREEALVLLTDLLEAD